MGVTANNTGICWSNNSTIGSTGIDKIAYLERMITLMQEQISHLYERVEKLEGQQTISVAGKKCTLDELTDAVADKLKAKANLW